jgi:hypothetical protein
MCKQAARTLSVLLLATLGLTAFVTTSAQAGEVKVLGSASLATGIKFQGSYEGVRNILIPSLGIEVPCSKGLIEGEVNSGPAGKVSLKATLTECSVFGLSEGKLGEKLPCSVVGGSIILAEVGEVVLHAGDAYLITTGQGEGGVFALVAFKSGEGCPLTLKNVMKGSHVFKFTTGDLNLGPEVTEPLLEASDTIQKLLGGKLFFGNQEYFLMGSSKLTIVSVNHKGCKFGAI